MKKKGKKPKSVKEKMTEKRRERGSMLKKKYDI